MHGWLVHSRLAHCKSARLRTSTAQHCGVPVTPVQRGVAACRFGFMVSVGKAEARAREREAAMRVVMCMVAAGWRGKEAGLIGETCAGVRS